VDNEMSINKIRNALHATVFEYGFEELFRAYRTALSAAIQSGINAEETVRKRHRLGADEPIPPVTHDDDGFPLFDFWEEVGEINDEADSTTNIIRIAFLIALFHFWEKHSNRWVRRSSYDHAAVMVWLKGQGGRPNEDLIKELELAANCAKHGPGWSCDELCRRRPDLFGQTTFRLGAHNLKIDEATLDSFFEAVRSSGPKA
jgi:hypothetical protein